MTTVIHRDYPGFEEIVEDGWGESIDISHRAYGMVRAIYEVSGESHPGLEGFWETNLVPSLPFDMFNPADVTELRRVWKVAGNPNEYIDIDELLVAERDRIQSLEGDLP